MAQTNLKSPKSKGADFERKVCAILSLWLSNNVSNNLFQRAESSGARFTSTRAHGHEIGRGGDVFTSHPDTYWFSECFVVECKAWINIGLTQFIIDGHGLIADALKQAEQSITGKQLPMLIAKQNYFIPLVVFPYKIPPFILAGRRYSIVAGLCVMALDEFVRINPRALRKALGA